MTGLPAYPDCKHFSRPTAEMTFNKEIADALAKDYRVMPLFEKGLFEYKYRTYYSLDTNKFLKCRWQSYVQSFHERVMSPFVFVNIRDYHFYNCLNRLQSGESIFRKKDFRYKLAVGPGVDFCGQMPIPQDLYMKRGIQKPLPGPKKYNKPELKEREINVDEKSVEKKI